MYLKCDTFTDNRPLHSSYKRITIHASMCSVASTHAAFVSICLIDYVAWLPAEVSSGLFSLPLINFVTSTKEENDENASE